MASFLKKSNIKNNFRVITHSTNLGSKQNKPQGHINLPINGCDFYTFGDFNGTAPHVMKCDVKQNCSFLQFY